MSNILIVEEQPQIQSLLTIVLRSVGHRTHPVRSAGAALEIIHQESCELLLIDKTMPETTGLELLKTLREQGNRIPVLKLAAGEERPLDLCPAGDGSFETTLKPCGLGTLLLLIQRSLGNR
jgi:DNA-binding NtrC family response regulator